MYLKSLTMKGFKSFAGKSELDFEPGTTVIVGPNGSGKSNIVDAFLWVTGEQSARSLRSSKMQDVIFAGSAQKSPMGVSEVTLSFDNSTRIFPVDYEEVAFTRRLFRSGESEYLMNGTACRLTDINDLLMHTNMGRDMYSIVGQGRLDGILNSRPDERRILIEESAGLAKYKRRKEKALRKLAATERNLTRIRDILAEIRRQLKPLETQAKLAKEHKNLVDGLRGAEIEYILQELDALTEVRERTKKEALDVGRRMADVSAAAEDGRVQTKELEAGLAALMERLDSLKERRFALMTNGERLRGRVGLLKEKESNLRLVGERFVDEAAGLAEELDGVAKELVETEKQIAVTEKALREAEAKLAGPGADAAKATANLVEIRQSIQITKAKVEAEEAYLAQAGAKREGGKTNWPKGVTGYIWDLIEVEKGYETAVEALMGPLLSAVVAENAVAGQKLTENIADWPELLVGTLLENAPAKNKKIPADLRAITEFIQPKGLKSGVYEAFFANAYLAEDMAAVWKHAEDPAYKGASFVTRAGETLRGGLARPAGKGKEDVLVRQRRVDDMTKEIARLEASEKETAAKLAQAEKQKTGAEEKVAPLRKALGEGRITAQVLAERKRLLESRLKTAGAQTGKPKASDSLNAKDMKEQAERIGRLRVLMERLLKIVEDHERRTSQEIVEAGRQEAALREKLSANRRQLGELERQIAVIERDAHKEEIAEAQLEPKISALEEQLNAEFGLTPAKAKAAHPKLRQRDELLAVMRQTRDKMDYLGPINPIAAEEFEEVQQRQEHLETQTRDLKRSEQSLRKVIGLMDKQMSERFIGIFNKVNESFQEVFKNMFPDGKAQLILTDPDDILNTGIEIEAQPSGRRLKKVSLLSGGESAMTALALLFGLFQINPAPFYILDEADVALDDVNLQRFVALIKQFKSRAQFLIVTHQRRTMEVADILYGVTMQRDGVSKVLSQKLEEAS